MDQPVQIVRAGSASIAHQNEGFLRGSSIANAFVLLIIGVVMLVTSFLASIGVGLLVAEIFLSVAMLCAGVLLLRKAMNKKNDRLVIGLLPGEIALAAALLYLGVVMPVFHQGLTSYGNAVIQFIAVMAGLVFGAVALALSGASQDARPVGKLSAAASLRDGVILITGTILLAIALGQLSGATLKPPLWNWISFLGITIPGMLVLIAREGAKEKLEKLAGFRNVLGLLATEFLLIVGLAIMLDGSYANLNLGMNGFTTGIKGNMAGLVLWIGAALFLILVHGGFKMALAKKNRLLSYRIVSGLLYVVGAIAFIYGERSILSGQVPMFAVGDAAPAAALILVGALVVLVVARIAAQKVSSGSIVQ